MFYAEHPEPVREAMRKAGLQEVRFQFDYEGTKVLF
jgi:D-glycero-alpha-D-manno-heptose-7-phosphate kinase